MASKGTSRPPIRIRPTHEAEAELGGSIDLDVCGRRRVQLRSDHEPTELVAMRTASVLLDEDRRVVLRRRGATVALVTSDVSEMRHCLDAGVRFEADLAHLNSRGGLTVMVRPLAAR